MTDAVFEITKAIQQLNDDLLQFYTPAVQDICSKKILQNPNWNIF